MDRVIGNGDSIVSVAKDAGFFWEDLWNHGSNSDLKSKRKDPNVLYKGDVVHVPELEKKILDKACDQRHEFKRKGDPVKYRVRLLRYGKARKNEAYTLDLGGELLQGTTDADGKIEQWLPGGCKGGRLILNDGKEIYPVSIHRLDPVDEISGVQQRLKNLGYPVPMVSGTIDKATKAALNSFQKWWQLKETGEPDDATKAKLLELHP